MVSVIVPVYNVEKYIDECMESLVNQTYQNLEIILIYDKSVDKSYEHCVFWEEKDNRVFLIVNQERGGLGAARNIGLKHAKGDYILFVDSDDWLDKNYIEVLRSDCIRTNADFVSGSSYYEVMEDKVYLLHGMPEGMYETDKKRALLLSGDFCTMWKKLYRKDWLFKHKLWQPLLFHFEDFGMYPAMVVSGTRIYVSGYPGSYYRKGREGCLTDDNRKKMISDFGRAIQILGENTRGKLNHPKICQAMKYYLLVHYFSWHQIFLREEDREAGCLLENMRDEMLIPQIGKVDFLKPNYLVLGSFSLRWEVQKGCLIYTKVDRHYCFSSLISICSNREHNAGKQEVIHENAFRKQQIEQELCSTVCQELEKADENTIFFLDFLEERFDILQLEDGQYLTDSEAFRESSLRDISYRKRIKSGSPEFMDLWKEACDRFTLLLKKCLKPEQIVLVKNRMSTTYGNCQQRKKFGQVQELESINQMLEQMEDYFLSKMPSIMVTEYDMEYAFTDEHLKYGCRPEYSNNAHYMQTGLQIFEKILKEKTI